MPAYTRWHMKLFLIMRAVSMKCPFFLDLVLSFYFSVNHDTKFLLRNTQNTVCNKKWKLFKNIQVILSTTVALSFWISLFWNGWYGSCTSRQISTLMGVWKIHNELNAIQSYNVALQKRRGDESGSALYKTYCKDKQYFISVFEHGTCWESFLPAHIFHFQTDIVI